VSDARGERRITGAKVLETRDALTFGAKRTSVCRHPPDTASSVRKWDVVSQIATPPGSILAHHHRAHPLENPREIRLVGEHRKDRIGAEALHALHGILYRVVAWIQ